MTTTPRYASHYLRLGAWRCAYPLLTSCRDGMVKLEPFTQEVAGTVFFSGEIQLVCNELPLSPRCEDISIEQAQSLIARYGDWKIVLPT